MMSKNKLIGLTGIGYGESAEKRLGTGPQIAAMKFRTTDLAPSQFQFDLELANDTNIVPTRFSGADLDWMNNYYGRPKEDGVHWLYFISPEANNTVDGKFAGLFRTLPREDLLLRVHFGAATAQQITDGDVPGVEVELFTYEPAMVNGAPYFVRDRMKRWVWVTLERGNTGEIPNEYADFRRGPRIVGAHIADNEVTKLEILRGPVGSPVRRFYDTVESNNEDLVAFGRTPQAGTFHFDPIISGMGQQDSFRTVGDELLFRTWKTGTGSSRMLVELIDYYETDIGLVLK